MDSYEGAYPEDYPTFLIKVQYQFQIWDDPNIEYAFSENYT